MQTACLVYVRLWRPSPDPSQRRTWTEIEWHRSPWEEEPRKGSEAETDEESRGADAVSGRKKMERH